MAFPLPDLIVENVIRNGILDIQNNPDVIDRVFAHMTDGYANRKYGVNEIQKIKDILSGADPTEIAVVHSFHLAVAKTPSFSIQLGSQSEDESLARLEDFEENFCQPLSPSELASLVRATNVIPTSYNPLTGMVRVPDTVDLSDVHRQFIYEDGSNLEHIILSGISNTVGDKYFFIAKQSTPDIVNPGIIKSFLTEKSLTRRGVTDNISLLIGVHTTEPLLTKYLFILLQFFLLSRKEELIQNCLIVSSLSGSDFNPDLAYQGDKVFTRFLTLKGKIENSWDSDMYNLVDNINITTSAVS